MPIWLRTFTYKKIEEYLDRKAQAQEKAYQEAQGVQELTPSTQTITPPDFVSRAPRK